MHLPGIEPGTSITRVYRIAYASTLPMYVHSNLNVLEIMQSCASMSFPLQVHLLQMFDCSST